MSDNELVMVEYNWKKKYFHWEPARTRIRKNASQVIHEGKPRNPDWIVVGLCTWDEVDELSSAFVRARDKAQRK